MQWRRCKKFLNSQFTNDIKKLENYSFMLSGYCNPKGRVISIFYIFQIDTEYFIYTTLDTSELLFNKLNMYKMMSKVEVEILNSNLFGITTNINKEEILNDIRSQSIKNFYIFDYLKNQFIINIPNDCNKKINLFSDIVNKMNYIM